MDMGMSQEGLCGVLKKSKASLDLNGVGRSDPDPLTPRPSPSRSLIAFHVAFHSRATESTRSLSRWQAEAEPNL